MSSLKPKEVGESSSSFNLNNQSSNESQSMTYSSESSSQCFLHHFMVKSKKPLIGVEYVVELYGPQLKEPFYVCTLCDKRCDPRNIMSQMTSHSHRMKYLDRHFPKTMNLLNHDKKFNIDMKFREEVLTSIALKIQSKFGRNNPKIYLLNEFERNKSEIIENIKKLYHPCENDFSESETVLLKDFNIENCSKEISDSGSDEKLATYYEKKKQILTARELSKQSELKFKEAYAAEKFKNIFKAESKKIEEKFKNYFKIPESHPKYMEEWKAFWSRRYNELLAQGKDANGHDYKPEWVEFWMPRMRLIKLKEIEDKKLEICVDLKITRENARKYENDFSSPKRAHPRSRSPSPDSPRFSQKSRSSSSSSDEDRHRRRDDSKRQRRDRSDSRIRSEITDDAPINIVTVCRLLTALESELGIIAPRLYELLEKSVEMERNEANSSEKLLTDFKYLNFLDTVKEKLKGLLSADMVGPSRMIPVKRAIKNIAILLSDAKKLSVKVSENVEMASTSSKPDSVELAKLEIAKVLAQTLIDQGRTDVSSEELSEIVDEFMKSQMAQEKEKSPVPEVKKEPEQKFKPSSSQELKEDESGLENLTDDDLKTLLRNFSDLTEEEQKKLIKYLEKLKKHDSKRVRMLSKYVDAGDDIIQKLIAKIKNLN